MTVTESRMSPRGTFSVLVTDFHPVVSCRWRRGFYRPHGCGLNGTDYLGGLLGVGQGGLQGPHRTMGKREITEGKMVDDRCRPTGILGLLDG